MTKRSIAAFLALAIAPLCASAAQIVTENDFQRLVNVHSPVLSPDGKRAVVEVSRTNWNEDRYESDLVLVDVATHASRTLTYGRKGLSDPAFSPDGTRLAFVADDGAGDDAKSQVFVMPLDGGDARPVTKAKEGVDQFAWRPDGEAIAYVTSESDPEKKGADKYRNSFVFTTEPIVARSHPHAARLYVVTLSKGSATQLTSGDGSVATGEGSSSISWSHDGKTIAFVLVPSPILNEESNGRIALVDVATHEVRPLTGHTAWESDPQFSPDGTHVAYVYSNGDSQINLVHAYVTTPAGGPGVEVSSAVDRSVAGKAWSRDSKSLYFVVSDRSMVALYRVSIAGGAPARLETGNLNLFSDLTDCIAADGSMIFTASSTKQPTELYARSASGTLAKLTDYNAAIASLDLASAERVTFPSTAGVDGDGVLYTPPGFTAGTKYPLVLFIHGGPTSSSYLNFDFWAQVMAARGWLVLRPNYRGSTDLGLKYQRAVLYDPEEGPGKDIMAAIDAVRAKGIVNNDKIAVGGWSYGGIMTAWMISKYHIWKAAVSGASVNDWITDYGTADDSGSDVALFHGSPFLAANTAEWRNPSAISYVGDVTTPVLILSDVGDNRDPFATSSMYWRALRDNKKDATLRVWPVVGHFPRDPVRAADVYHYWIDFIAKHFSAS